MSNDYRIKTVRAASVKDARLAPGGKHAMIVRHTGPMAYTLFRRVEDAVGHPSGRPVASGTVRA